MRSTSRRSSSPRWVFSTFLPSRGAASSGLTDMLRTAARKSTFHMRAACAWVSAAAVEFCKQLFPPQIAVGLFNVAAQLVPLLRRHLARPVGTLLPLAIDLTHVFAHALALLLLHLALLPRVALAR